MSKYRIRGNNRIMGQLSIGGAKNAVLPIIAAVCLNESICEIHNVPPIADTLASIEILKSIGCTVEFEGTTLKVDSSGPLSHDIPCEIAGRMRSSILFMGAMLGRVGKINIAMPGGCKLGARAIDLHVGGLTKMGAKICIEDDRLHCEAAQGLRGAHISLHTASVGATENLMLAAVLAKGETVIENAAREPEIIDLAKFLNGMGAKVEGAGTGTIIITGVERLKAAAKPHSIMPDRIVAGTYLVAAAMTGGLVTLQGVHSPDLAPVIEKLREMGCTICHTTNCVTLAAPKRLKAVEITTEVHPGFPTDMQAQFVAALAIAEGRSVVRETIFESRHAHAADLNRMGATIRISDDCRTFIIKGMEKLHGATVAAQDLRGGAALILAALAAVGETIVTGAEYVQRGYACIEEDLRQLGADIVLL